MLSAQLFLSRDGGETSQIFVRCAYGIGAAVSIRGQVIRGDSGQCAEIGHIPVVPRGGKPCSCGKSGCLETVASPTAILTDALALLDRERTPLLWQTAREKGADALTLSDVLDAARGGDGQLAHLTERAADALAGALKSAIYVLDPGRLVLYGPLFEHPYYMAKLKSALSEGVDPAHDVPAELSRWSGKLEQRAAGLLAVQRFLDAGGLFGACSCGKNEA